MANLANLARIGRLLRSTWPLRWLRSALELLHGARVHPACELLGGSGIRLERCAAVGARSRLVLIDSGTILLERGAWLSSDVALETDARISIGSATTVQRRCSLNGSVRIGRGCLLAPNVFISSRTHPFRAFPHRYIREQEGLLRGPLAAAGEPDRPVWIQDDCWLGVNAVISPGVTVCKGSVIGANAVVTRDVPPYSVVGGVPARVIGSRLAWQPPSRIDAASDADLVYILAGFAGPFASNVRRILITAGEPLVAALNRFAQAIRVYCTASGNLEVQVAASRIKLQPGDNTFAVPTHGLELQYDALLLRVTLCSASASEWVDVSRVECIDAERPMQAVVGDTAELRDAP